MNIYACTVILIIFSQKLRTGPGYSFRRIPRTEWHHGNILWLACDQRAGGRVEGRNSAAFIRAWSKIFCPAKFQIATLLVFTRWKFSSIHKTTFRVWRFVVHKNESVRLRECRGGSAQICTQAHLCVCRECKGSAQRHACAFVCD
jgi:hypothetical protein